MTEDEQLAEVLKIANKARVTIHVRGTDKNPVVELRDKLMWGRGFGPVVGGIELKRRLAQK